MAYISAGGLNWLAARIAGVEITISAHTASPGDAGTANELSSSGGNPVRNYARKAVPAANWSADAATTDNDAVIEIFTPNATSAGDTVSHIGYWFPTGQISAASGFFGWVALRAGVTTVESEPLRIAAGTADFTFSLASA